MQRNLMKQRYQITHTENNSLRPCNLKRKTAISCDNLDYQIYGPEIKIFNTTLSTKKHFVELMIHILSKVKLPQT